MNAHKSLTLLALLMASTPFAAQAEEMQVQSRLLPSPQVSAQFGDAWHIKSRGRLEMDAVKIHNDQAEHVGGIYDRRTRFGFELGYGQHWKVTAEIDMVDDDEGEYTDLELAYDNLENMRFQFGHFKEYFGMERTDSSAPALFIERAAIDIFTPQRNLGVQGVRYNERGSASFGVFTDSMQTNSNKDKLGLTSRMTYSWPVAEAGMLHMGGSGSYRKMEQVGFSAAPDTASTSIDAVDTGTLYDVDTMMLGGLEAGFGWRNLLLRGEYMAAHLDRDTTQNATLDGWYTQASWLLTGEDYVYSVEKDALFQPVSPARPFSLKQNTWGALELGARYQEISLQDGSINGGNMKAVTGGLNWYPNTSWRVSGNVTYIDTDENAVTPNDNPVITAMRVRVLF